MDFDKYIRKNTKIRNLFLTIELIAYAAFLYLDIFKPEQVNLSNGIKMFSITVCFAYAAYRGIEGGGYLYITAASCLILFADSYLLFSNHPLPGVVIFIGVQFCYQFYLNGRKQKVFPIAILSAIVLFCIFYALSREKPEGLTGAAFVYAVGLMINLVIAWKKSRKMGYITGMAVGLPLLALCDIHVAICNLWYTSSYLEFASVAMWLFYLPSQILIVGKSGKDEYEIQYNK